MPLQNRVTPFGDIVDTEDDLQPLVFSMYKDAIRMVGLVAAGVTLPLVSAHAVRQYWWVLAITPLAAACLYPPVVKFGLDLVLRVLRRAPLEGSVGRGGMARALGWTILGWLCFGAHAWFLISVFAGKSGHTFALSLGGYALAWAVGFLIVFFPVMVNVLTAIPWGALKLKKVLLLTRSVGPV